MQSSKEQQEEIRKPFSVTNGKKQSKTIQWEKKRSLQENQRFQGNSFHAKMDSMKDRNGIDLTEAEDIKKRQ